VIRNKLDKRLVFREVNEQMHRVSARFPAAPITIDALCECGRPGCAKRMNVPVRVYETVRQTGDRFLVAPGHEHPGRERVTKSGETYRVVLVQAEFRPGRVGPVVGARARLPPKNE
jgi:hypothetical protein